MNTRFDMKLEEAMKLLELRGEFAESEYRSNYKKIMRSIHPDVIGNVNQIARKILEEKAKDVNIAKEVIDDYLVTRNSTYNYKNNDESAYTKQDNKEYGRKPGYREQESKKEEQDKNEQDNTKNSKEQNNKNLISKSINIFYILWAVICAISYAYISANGFSLTNLGKVFYASLIIIPILLFLSFKLKNILNAREFNLLVKVFYGFWSIIIFGIYIAIGSKDFILTNLGKIVLKIFISIPIIAFLLFNILNKVINIRKD